MSSSLKQERIFKFSSLQISKFWNKLYCERIHSTTHVIYMKYVSWIYDLKLLFLEVLISAFQECPKSVLINLTHSYTKDLRSKQLAVTDSWSSWLIYWHSFVEVIMKQLSLQILIPVKKEERRRKVDLCHGQSYVFVMISKLNKQF